MIYILFILSVIACIALYLYYSKKINTIKNERKEDPEKERPIIVNPTFQIVYEKEELQKEDIDILANYVINFSSIDNKQEVINTNVPNEDKVFVHFESIQFKQLIKIKL